MDQNTVELHCAHSVCVFVHLCVWLCYVCVCVCVQTREMMANTMRAVLEKVTGSKLKADEIFNQRSELSQHRCYKAAVSHYKHTCFNWHKTEVRDS